MKKLFLVAAVAAFSAVNAQSTGGGLDGTAFISGQVGYTSTKDNNSNAKSESFSVLPSVGKFISPSVAIGGAVGYKSETESVDMNLGTTYVNVKSTDAAFVVMPFVRKYWSVGEKLYIFGQLDVPLAFGKMKMDAGTYYNQESKYTSYGANLRPGLDYFINNNWTIETTVGGFGFNAVKPEGGETVDTFNIGLNLNTITFGVKYLFK